MAPGPDALPLSIILAGVGHAFAVDEAAAGTAADDCPILRGILPTRVEVLVQELENAGSSPLNAIATFNSLAHLAYCVSVAVSGLLRPLAAAYDCEPVGAGAPGWFDALTAAGTALTFRSFSVGPAGTLEGYTFFEFVFFGRTLAASRDAPAAPTRRVLDQLTAFVRAANLSAPAAALTASALAAWFRSTHPSDMLHILTEVGISLDRREQSLRDRHLLAYGTAEQRSFVVVDLLMNYPLKADLGTSAQLSPIGRRDYL